MNPAKTFRSKKEFVYESLREQILNSELRPGERLIIDELSTNLGVSAIPVRESLQQLQSDGLVTIEPYVGARVTEIPKESIQEIFALLEATETISGQAACRRMSEADFEEMEQLLQRMDVDIEGDQSGLTAENLERWANNNLQLHQLICERANMPLVHSTMNHVLDHWNRLRRIYLEPVLTARVKEAQKDHWEMDKALRTRDPANVADVIHQHNQRAVAAYINHLETI